MKELIELLSERGWTIGSCESLTAGLFSSSIAAIPGASKVLRGAIVTYQSECKENIVHVPHKIIERDGVISSACVEAMAIGAQALLKCDVCVSFSGNAGPEMMEDKPVGTVFFGLVIQDQCYSYEMLFQGERNEIRQQCVDFMCDKIIEVLKEREDSAWKK